MLAAQEIEPVQPEDLRFQSVVDDRGVLHAPDQLLGHPDVALDLPGLLPADHPVAAFNSMSFRAPS